ncbi:hypothetical protein BLJAPNOD_02985 [Ensifer sp. M14]|uniref:helicase RepA family protein n=1 Tax=Ensifer sp. M14 TaxID=2203782 RepID=UPI000E1DA443|nr:helicase RepA family protein [Ensifer sp. M14]RDL51839.1 hypothetical protein BLJAPNOD_02985 [Ensifer sp. M14]
MHGNYDGHTRPPFQLIHLSQLDENEPEPETRVQRLMPRTGFATIYGPPGCGKTFWAIHLGLTVAAGLPFFGCETERSGVVYIAAEAGNGIKKRIIAARDRLGVTDAEFYLITEAPNLGFANPNDSNRLILDIQAARIPNLGMIFLDTVARVTPGSDENSVMHMGAFIANADRIARHFDCIVVGVHHTGKDDGRGMRGSSAINGATDCEWWVRKDDGGMRSAKLTKMRDGEGDLSMTFDLDVVEMADGTTTCVIAELSQPEVRKTERKVWQPTGAAKIAYEALVELVNERGSVPPENNHIPSRTRTTSIDSWRAHAIARGLCSGGNDDAVRMSFKRASEKLLNTNKIATWNSHVWLVL